MTVVRLAISPDEAAERLRRRDTGAVLEKHLRIARAIARDLDHAHVEDFIVGNEGRTIRATAMEVLRLIDWMTD
jgi:hypothetical protein